MPDSGVSTVVILLSACVGMLFLLVLIALKIGGRLVRLERLLTRQKDEDAVLRESLPPLQDAESSGAFEEFLREDPARRRMVKSEQFAAYRQWRQARGLNWTNS
jgi:hypothetical protein